MLIYCDCADILCRQIVKRKNDDKKVAIPSELHGSEIAHSHKSNHSDFICQWLYLSMALFVGCVSRLEGQMYASSRKAAAPKL